MKTTALEQIQFDAFKQLTTEARKESSPEADRTICVLYDALKDSPINVSDFLPDVVDAKIRLGEPPCHIPGPYKVHYNKGAGFEIHSGNRHVASMSWWQFDSQKMNKLISGATAKRLVDCFNACEGINNPANVVKMIQAVKDGNLSAAKDCVK